MGFVNYFYQFCLLLCFSCFVPNKSSSKSKSLLTVSSAHWLPRVKPTGSETEYTDREAIAVHEVQEVNLKCLNLKWPVGIDVEKKAL